MTVPQKLMKPEVIKTEFGPFFDYFFHRNDEYNDRLLGEGVCSFVLYSIGKGQKGNDAAGMTQTGGRQLILQGYDNADLYIIRFAPKKGRPVVVKIGRLLTNDLIISDSSVSRNHAEFYCAEDEISLCNLGPKFGTHYKPKHTRDWETIGHFTVAELEDEYQLKFGVDTIFTFREPDAFLGYMKSYRHMREPKPFDKNDRSPLEPDIKKMYADMAKIPSLRETQVIEPIDD